MGLLQLLALPLLVRQHLLQLLCLARDGVLGLPDKAVLLRLCLPSQPDAMHSALRIALRPPSHLERHSLVPLLAASTILGVCRPVLPCKGLRSLRFALEPLVHHSFHAAGPVLLLGLQVLELLQELCILRSLLLLMLVLQLRRLSLLLPLQGFGGGLVPPAQQRGVGHTPCLALGPAEDDGVDPRGRSLEATLLHREVRPGALDLAQKALAVTFCPLVNNEIGLLLPLLLGGQLVPRMLG
mmetsp:Transcript_11728/g.28068  ORF Transcript_11728/g.28068 Transcript_11728/m.28068 type:complete len:240 (-) Transcript_11728:162-881(-)